MAFPSLTGADIEHRFTNHPPATPEAGEALDAVTALMISTGTALLSLPDGREKASALTALEEVSFWAKAAIARGQ
jgi:hypothetical protein